MTPAISVLLPCRNAAGTLRSALTSILAQTFPSFEVIVIDDGSTDESWQVAGMHADPRLRVYRTEPRGLVPALRTAAGHARGSLLARMDADDTCSPDRLERQVAFLDRHPDVVACGTAVRYFSDQPIRAGTRRYEAWINSAATADEVDGALFVECPIAHPTLCVRRCAFEASGGYRDPAWPEDYDLIMRLRRRGRLANLPDVIHGWRDGPHRLSRTDGRYRPGPFRRCKAHYLTDRTAGRPLMVWGAGPIGKAFGRAAETAGLVVTRFIDVDPRKIGQRIGPIPVLGPAGLPPPGDTYIVAAVGSPGARDHIGRRLEAWGHREIDDWCAVA